MNNMKKIMVFGVALLMVLTVFAAIPTPTKAAQFTLYGMIYNTDGSAGDANTANSMSQCFGWRDVAPTEISHHIPSPNDITDADGSGTAAYEYADHGSQWPTGPAAGQEVCLDFEVANGVNGWTGGNQSTGQHQTITSSDITGSETDMATDAQLNDLPDPSDDGSGNMAWDAMAHDTNGILSGYEIYESPDNSAGSYTAFDWVAAGTTTYSLSSLTANNYYKIGFSYLYGYNTTVMSDVAFQNIVVAHTATVTGPTNTVASNVASITITYNYDSGTTGVALYYTTDGGSNWNYIANDSSIDGSYDWTIPADGTYGWMAVADGETAPTGGESPEASYIYDGTAPTVSSTTPANSANNVAVDTNVAVVYSESMDTSVTPTLSDNLGTSYTFNSWSDDHTATWTHADWAFSTTVNPTVSGAKDTAGNTQTSDSWSFTTAADLTPPAVTINSVVDPLEGGSTQTVHATVDDSSTGNSNIVSASYSVIAPSGAVVYDHVSLAADDGNFDSPTESVTASYSTVGWATGTYTVYVYGSDGNIGSTSTTYTEQDTNAPIMYYKQPLDGGTVSANQNITVLVDIEDAYQISDIDNSTVILSWNNGTAHTLTMTYVSNGTGNTVKYVSGRWSGSIPAQAENTTISYHIGASDVAGNSVNGPTYTITASSSEPPSDPYPVYGYVYLYNGNGGAYSPLLCDGTAYGNANVDVSWINSSSGATNTVTKTTDGSGRYQVDLYDYSDGGIVTVTATDGNGARYNTNITTIVAADGGSMVNVTFGVPQSLEITSPAAGSTVLAKNAFNVVYTVYDVNGVIAPGYYGTVHLVTGDALATMPADYTFGGYGVDDGTATVSATFITGGEQYLNATDTVNDMTPPTLYPEVGKWWDNITLEVLGGGFTWDFSQPGWHVVSVPQVPIASNNSASEIVDLIYKTAHDNGTTLSTITIANRTGSTPSTYDTYMYGSGGTDFAIEVGCAYWVYVDQGFARSVLIQANNYTTTTGIFTKTLFQGWNMIGLAHNDTVGVLSSGGLVQFANDGTAGNIGIAPGDGYITYTGQPWYISHWNVGTQKYQTYIYKFGFNQPGDPQNVNVDIYAGATGFWLYVNGGGTITYSVEA